MPFVESPSGLRPNKKDHKIDLWLDEQIWGHRIWDSQSPWLVFLEFLNVAEARHRQGQLFSDNAPYPLRYRPRQRMYLRNILFNNDEVFRIAEEQGDSGRAWQKWLKSMEDSAQGVPERDFSYLRERFHSFDEFAKVVRIIRGTAVERESNKRWSSRFVFPFGQNSLYIDLNINLNGQPSREYINFGRSGEILYTMLSRSSYRSELTNSVRVMVEGSNRWDKLVASLQPDDKNDQEGENKSCFLPYLYHPVYDDLARDWLAIYKLQLPAFDGYPHLVTLSALHLLRYHLAVASIWADNKNPFYLVCEIIAPKKTLVREIALESYGLNNGISTQAAEFFVERIRQSHSWQSALTEGDSGAYVRCLNVVREAVWWGDDYKGANDPDKLLDELKGEIRKGHKQHVAQVHRSYGREIGLISRRGTTRFRYAPTDQLIKTLLFATVDRRMEFDEFLAHLFKKYGLVIGDHEAEQVLSTEEFDRKAFQANARRLEQRLASLGLLRRLSDACAYVENPYGRWKND
ncbi:MAG: hypothetical protein HXX08_14615 [Chloroflexi bacterium]|uniref:Uncharacterized protein n=1 Tax=Candidatus Chlorohelix allophototropha TaxID=3003348 RepID=A0A8T7M4S1_9CHLR|nr:hypothetical protein [Chloroflexota bacterium]